MAALSAGAKAPEFALQSADGKKASLADALKKGPVVAAFFKVSCPTCQFTAPFLERLHEAYGGEHFTLWGISQDDAADTREFNQEFEIEFPTLIDDNGYRVSNQYGITNVPTLFLIAPDGKIQESSADFSKKKLNVLNNSYKPNARGVRNQRGPGGLRFYPYPAKSPAIEVPCGSQQILS